MGRIYIQLIFIALVNQEVGIFSSSHIVLWRTTYSND